MRSQVGLESEGIDGGEESFDGVERGSGDGRVLRHVTSTPRQNCVDGGNTIGRRLREGRREDSVTTEMPEIEDARCSKSMAPPPTAQTPGSNWLIFWLETPHGNTFRGTEAIFEFHPRS